MNVLVSTLLLSLSGAHAGDLDANLANLGYVVDGSDQAEIPFQPSDDDLMLTTDPVGEAPPTANIVNGVRIEDESFAEVVYLQIEGLTGNESSCTGSLIHPEWVLTAAHCVDGDPSGIIVHFGNEQPTNKQVAATEWYFHPDWEEDAEETGNFIGDVAVIHLSEAVNDVFVMAINEVEMDQTWIDQEIRFIGFGITEWQGSGSGIKRTAEVPITAVPETAPYLVRAWNNGETSTCQGDSGGPGVVEVGSGYVQVSVTSHGVECGRGPSGHMRVDHYLDWIQLGSNAYVGGFDESGEKPPIDVQTAAAAPPTFVCNRRLDEDDELSVSLGVVPFDLTCGVQYNRVKEIDTVTWDWGDGNTSTVDDSLYGTHTYTTGGRYTIRMCADGTRGDDDAEWGHCVSRSETVRACDLPNVQFDVEKTESLTYTFRNRTSLADSYLCVFDVQWDIFAGTETTGEPLVSLKTWEPTYTFDEPGTYTAVLNVGGLAGTAAAKADFAATLGGGSCSSTGGAGLGLMGIAFALVGLRRRRD